MTYDNDFTEVKRSSKCSSEEISYPNDTSIAVVIPAYNEEKLVGKTIDSLPGYIDKIVVVDDDSQDDTIAQIEERRLNQPERIILIKQ